jgi:hypothetical protein
MRMVAEYLERVLQFERWAAEATDLALKESFLEQAVAYRKLAEKRAASLKLPPINLPAVIPPESEGPP